jgi:hypothetical protein
MNNIKYDAILQLIQDFRSQLDTWGVNSETLMVVGGIAALLFILSLREVATWYFRINQVRDEVRELRAQLLVMHKMVAETRDYLIQPEAPVVPMRPEELMKAAQGMKEAPKFRLDH